MEVSYPLRPGEPDCRDYLRTGRCKYGESCKYNHPTNVEDGGGVKPTNPGEPLFPMRPNEPPCQYFLKHGTCKFGQSCKFNHPSGMLSGFDGMQANSNALPSGLVFLTTTNSTTCAFDASPGLRHSGSMDEVASAHSNVQILPQRPSEQNCIFFLRNGRCKYGPTCKFHHPIETATTTIVDKRRSNSFSGYGQSPRLQPITEQRGDSQKPTHIMLPDGQIAVIIDPSSLQHVNEANAQPTLYMSPNGSLQTLQSLDQTPMLSATTASSNTVSSSLHSESTINIDMWGNKTLNVRSQGTTISGPTNGSGSNLSAYGSDESIPSTPQGHYQQYNQTQVNTINPLSRPWSIEINQSQQYQNQVNLESNMRDLYDNEDQRKRSISRGNYQEQSNHYTSAQSLSLSAQIAHDQGANTPYRTAQRNKAVSNGHERNESADGLTEMTSALLTMMDRHDSSEEVRSHASQSISPYPDRMTSQKIQSSMSNLSYDSRGHYSNSAPTIYGGSTISPARPSPPPGMTSLQQASCGSYEEQLLSQHNQNTTHHHNNRGNYIQSSISPTWGENAPRF